MYGSCPTARDPVGDEASNSDSLKLKNKTKLQPTNHAVTVPSSDSDLEDSHEITDDPKQALLSPRDRDPETNTRPTLREREMALGEVLYAYDLTLAQVVFQRFGRGKGWRIMWEVLCQSGDGILWFLTVLPILGVLWVLGALNNVSPAACAMFKAFYTCNFVDLAGIIVFKLFFKRQRPPHHVTDGRFVGPDVHSFPSGHATRAFCIVALFLELGSSTEHAWILENFFHMPAALCEIFIIAWGCSIAFARVALGRHYPSDVAAGILIGSLLFYPIARAIIFHFGMLDRDPSTKITSPSM